MLFFQSIRDGINDKTAMLFMETFQNCLLFELLIYFDLDYCGVVYYFTSEWLYHTIILKLLRVPYILL